MLGFPKHRNNPATLRAYYLRNKESLSKKAKTFRDKNKELFKERAHKIKVQQRLNALIQRNGDLTKRTPKSKTTLHIRLKSTQVKLKNELNMTNLHIESQEENIVRSGCPGLAL